MASIADTIRVPFKKLLALLGRFVCYIKIQQTNLIYKRNSQSGFDTIYFVLINPKYIPIYETVFETIKKSTRCRAGIIITGRKQSFHLDAAYKRLLKQYDVIFFPGDKIFGITCNYLVTNTSHSVGKIKKGQVIHFPRLTKTAMEYFAKLFEDAMYSDGFPLSNKINHVVYTYNSEGSVYNLRMLPYKPANSSASVDSNKIRIVFFSQLPTLWQCAESIYEEMIRDPQCEVTVVQLPFYHENYQETEDAGTFLRKKKIPFIDWHCYDAFWEAPDVIIFLSPYDSTRPEGFKFEELYKAIPKTVYIPYALGVSGGYIIDYNFRLPIHTHAWKIYVRSHRYYEMFKRYCPENAQNVVVLGHPKTDLIYNLDRHQVPKWLIRRIKNRKVLLWNPHHTLKSDEWSTFLDWNEVLLDCFLKRKDLFLIVRPHPLLFKNLTALPDGEKKLKDFLDRAVKMENVLIDRSENYLDAFKVSDGLISDASSLLLEYLPTRKPILYTPKAVASPLNDDGTELVQYLYQATNRSQIEDFIDMVAQGKDPMHQLRVGQIEKFLFSVDGKAGRRIKDDIIESCMQESQQS